MADFKLYCFAESGNAYKAAVMLECCGLSWQPVKVDYFSGETRTPGYRKDVNEMGEVPVLIHGRTKLSQSGVILDYLAGETRKFAAKSDDERREVWRWILFDNHKLTSYLATHRFLIRFAPKADPAVVDFLRARSIAALGILDAHLAEKAFVIGKRPTIADLSLCAYLFFGDELGVPLDSFTHILNWLDRLRALPGWKGPYDLMPRARQT